MIAWEDFDNRATKVFCDNCHKEIDDGVARLIENIKKTRPQHMIFDKQWNLKLPFFDVAITLFRRRRIQFHAIDVLRKAKARQW